jgi:hypothetical protein
LLLLRSSPFLAALLCLLFPGQKLRPCEPNA